MSSGRIPFFVAMILTLCLALAPTVPARAADEGVSALAVIGDRAVEAENPGKWIEVAHAVFDCVMRDDFSGLDTYCDHLLEILRGEREPGEAFRTLYPTRADLLRVLFVAQQFIFDMRETWLYEDKPQPAISTQKAQQAREYCMRTITDLPRYLPEMLVLARGWMAAVMRDYAMSRQQDSSNGR